MIVLPVRTHLHFLLRCNVSHSLFAGLTLRYQTLSIVIISSCVSLQSRLNNVLPGEGPKETVRICLKAFRPLIQVKSLLLRGHKFNSDAGVPLEPGLLGFLLPHQRLLPSPARCRSRGSCWNSHGILCWVFSVYLLKQLCPIRLQAFVTMSFSRLNTEDKAFGRHYPELQRF